MKRLFPLFLALFSLLAFASCVDEEEFDDSPSGNFEALWKIIDERYCFFDYKNKEYGLDWDAVHDKYRVRVNDRMTSDQLFEVMADMLAELRDGHVNLRGRPTSPDTGAGRKTTRPISATRCCAATSAPTTRLPPGCSTACSTTT